MAFDSLTSEMQEGKGCKNDKLVYRAFRKGQDFFEIVIKQEKRTEPKDQFIIEAVYNVEEKQQRMIIF